MKQKVIITKGLPASGKTTWAKQWCKEHPEYKRINRDDLRAMIDDSVWSKHNETFIKLSRDMLLKLAIMQGFSVVFDETFLIPKNQQEVGFLIQSIADDLGVVIDVEIKEFDISPEECIIRDQKRTGAAHVGEKVIRDFYTKFVKSDDNQSTT